MKKIFIFVLILLSFSLFGCDNNLSQPKTNLEFWIGENVNDFDFSEYKMKYGMFGGNQYYGTGYVPTLGEEGQQIDPEYCVLYTVTSYPDYSSKSQHITSIHISDPTIVLYGLTINSSFEDIEYELGENQGFKIEKDEVILVATKGKYTFKFTSKSILLRVEVTNIFGIQF